MKDLLLTEMLKGISEDRQLVVDVLFHSSFVSHN